MSSKTGRKKSILILLLIVIMVVPFILNVPASFIIEIQENNELHEAGSSRYVVIPLSINVVEGTKISKERIEANIKRMNQIYNCEVVIFVWNGTVGTVPDPDGTPDGNISGVGSGGRRQVRNNASENAGGTGISITVGTDLGPGTNGITTLGNPHGAIVTNATGGETWAHEVQHALGQSHGLAQNATEDINGDAPGNGTGWDINGDGKINFEDMKYNLWGRADRIDNLINCSAILNASDDIPGARVKQRPQNIMSPPNTAKKTGIAFDGADDVMNWTSGLWTALAKFVDIIRGGIIKDYTTGFIKLWLEIANAPIDNCSYIFAFDYLQSSGDHISPYLKDADLIVTFRRNWGVHEVFMQTWDNDSGIWVPSFPGEFLAPFNMGQINETINYDDPRGSGYVESFFDVMLSIETNHPLIFSNLEGSFDMWITCEWNNWENPPLSDETQRVEVTLLDLPIETISIEGENVTAGDTMQVNGTSFTPNGNITIYFEGVLVGNIFADSTGSFYTTITIPNIEKENAILMVIDDQGKADAIYVNAYVIITDIEEPIPGFELFFVILAFLAIAIIFHQKKAEKNIYPFFSEYGEVISLKSRDFLAQKKNLTTF